MTATATAPPSLPRALARMLSLDDFEQAARRRLPRPIFGYIAGAAEDNQSLRANRDAFARYGFVPRVLVNVSARSQQFDLFGRRYDAPFGIAPMGLSALSAYRGDIVQARAARASNIPAILSGTSLIPLEDVIQAAPGAWFQAYLPGDPARIDALVERARKAGYETLVLTVDIPVSANRENNVRTGFSTPLKPSLRLAWDGLTAALAGRHLPAHAAGAWHAAFRELLRHARRAHPVGLRAARFLGARPPELGARGPHPPAMARRAGHQGHPASGRRGPGARAWRGRHHRLQPWRPPARRRGAAAAGAAGRAGRCRRHAGDAGQRRAPGRRRAQGAGAGCALRVRGPTFNYAAAIGGEAGVAHAIGLLRAEVDRNMAMLGINRLDELHPGLLRRDELPGR